MELREYVRYLWARGVAVVQTFVPGSDNVFLVSLISGVASRQLVHTLVGRSLMCVHYEIAVTIGPSSDWILNVADQ